MAESVYSPARASFYFRRQVFSLDHDRSCDHLVCWSWKWSVTERPLIDLPIASVKGRPEWGDLPMSIGQILRAHRSAKTIYAKPVDLEDKPRFRPLVMPLRCPDRC